ncbi:MAG: methylmalonyl-CoA epimerase [Dethiobacteria bacterium]|jgi:methylmalonyl-CoA/ethylmalonyl-CoA epimerase
MLKKIAHIGIAVKSIEGTAEVYKKVLGLEITREEALEGRGLRIAFLPIGESSLELIEPLDQENNIARFIAEKGEGMHHIAFEVEDLEKRLEELKEKGVRLLDQKPRPGASGESVAFINPESSAGLLVELVENLKK